MSGSSPGSIPNRLRAWSSSTPSRPRRSRACRRIQRSTAPSAASPRCCRRWRASAWGGSFPPIVRCLSQHATSSISTMRRRSYTAACATSSPNCPHRWHKPDRFRTLATDRWSSLPPHVMRWQDGCRCRTGWRDCQRTAAIASCPTRMMHSSRIAPRRKRRRRQFVTSCTQLGSRRLLRNRRKGVSMPYVIGIVLSVGVALFARYVGFDRDRAFYPTVMIVIASYYVLFAAMSGSVQTVVIESVVMTLFAAAAVAGFKSSTWVVVVALAGHGVFDAVHGHFIENAGMPAWWPPWCLAYDVGAAAGLAWFLRRGLIANDVKA